MGVLRVERQDRVKRFSLAVARAAVSVILIAAVLHAVDTTALAGAVRHLGATSLAAAAVLIAAQALVIAWRWHRIVVLLGGRLPPKDAVQWVFLGMFFNNALPTSVGGDAVRIWLLRKSGASLVLSIGSVAIERGTGIVVLGLMVSACVPAVWAMLDGTALRVVLAWIGPSLLAGLLVAALADRLLAGWNPRGLGKSLKWLGEELRRLGTQPLVLAELAALGVAASLTGLLAAYLLGESLGLQIGFPTCIVLVGGSVLLSVLPISLGGWGVREVSMVTLFGAAGASGERALALSLLWGLLPLLVSLPAGLLWWRSGASQAVARDEVGALKSAAPACQSPDPPR